MAAGDTHCINGHEWTPENTYVGPTGSRRCRACKKAMRTRTGRPTGRPRPVRGDARVSIPELIALREAQARSPEPHKWMREAACKGRDPDMFFPERGDNAEYTAAMAVCAQCPVRLDCLAANVDTLYGVFGGTSGIGRRRIRSAMLRRGVRVVAA